jgi:16S rRNA C967 or C1407 C5-methylase (RsmB/RsmF family)
MLFTNVKLISYSTCSIYREENEDAIEQILSSEEGANFELLDLRELVNINDYHTGITENTKKCLRTCKKCFNMDGFFVAVFKRKS